MLTVGWFSGGVSSAVAIKLVLDEVDKIIYIHVEDQHEDTMRFVRDCAKWYGKPIELLQSPLKSVDNALRSSAKAGGKGYIASPYHGAKCSHILKRGVREIWEYNYQDVDLRYVWGFDYSEVARAKRTREKTYKYRHLFPLINHKIQKAEAHKMLADWGIERPKMYDMGYNNNNCIGCVMGGKGYWNKIRKDFPDVYLDRVLMEHELQAQCMTRISLADLSPDEGE